MTNTVKCQLASRGKISVIFQAYLNLIKYLNWFIKRTFVMILYLILSKILASQVELTRRTTESDRPALVGFLPTLILSYSV